MKKITALLLALILVLSFAACGGEETPATEPATEPTTTEPATEAPAVDAPVFTDFSMSYSVDYVPVKSITVMDNGDGTCYVEYFGDVRKVDFAADIAILSEIAAAYVQSGLDAFNGQEVYGDGTATATFYATQADGTVVTGIIAGEVPQEFLDAIDAMDASAQEILADMPVYVPQPAIMGEIAENDMAAMNAILEGLNLPNADAFTISGIMKDEYYAETMGLSTDVSTVSAVKMQPNMMGGAVYDLNIVTVAEGVTAEAVAQEFQENIDWTKWVCVSPAEALVATKDNQTLCLLGSDSQFADTKAAIEAAGWTVVVTLENPNM